MESLLFDDRSGFSPPDEIGEAFSSELDGIVDLFSFWTPLFLFLNVRLGYPLLSSCPCTDASPGWGGAARSLPEVPDPALLSFPAPFSAVLGIPATPATTVLCVFWLSPSVPIGDPEEPIHRRTCSGNQTTRWKAFPAAVVISPASTPRSATNPTIPVRCPA